MNKRLLLGYQLLTGLSDAGTGLLLVLAPAFTLRLMGLHVAPDTLPFLAYIGVFVLSTGLACFYGAVLVRQARALGKLETVWLLTGITRALVTIFVVSKVAAGTLEAGWISVALTDGFFAAVQAVGLLRGWLRDA